jgi:hypothetical protein
MTQIDYTKIKVNPAAKIIKCPKCGRNGELTKYKDGTGNIIHLKVLETTVFPAWNVKDSCFLTVSDRKKMEAVK